MKREKIFDNGTLETTNNKQYKFSDNCGQEQKEVT